MRNFMRSRWARVSAVVAVSGGLAVGGYSIASASIPDSSGVVHACYKTTVPVHGENLQVIDSEVGGSCASGYSALNWSSKAPGYEYLGVADSDWQTSAAPVSVGPGSYQYLFVGCTQGDVAIGVNTWVGDEGSSYANTPSALFIRQFESHRADLNGQSANSWQASTWVAGFANESPSTSYTVHGQAVCWHPGT